MRENSYELEKPSMLPTDNSNLLLLFLTTINFVIPFCELLSTLTVTGAFFFVLLNDADRSESNESNRILSTMKHLHI